MINLLTFNPLFFIPIGVAVLISILSVIIALSKRKNIAKQKEENIKQNNTFLEIFGGEDNIVSCEAKTSRLVLILKDYSLLNEEKLKENGVTSMIKATNKITLIIGEKSKELEEFINQNKRP